MTQPMMALLDGLIIGISGVLIFGLLHHVNRRPNMGIGPLSEKSYLIIIFTVSAIFAAWIFK